MTSPGTLSWMIETLREELAVMGADWDEDRHLAAAWQIPGRPRPLPPEWQAARKIVNARAAELTDDETEVLMDAGREELLSQIDPEFGAFLIDGGVMAAANRALLREQGEEPDPDADDSDVADDEDALLDVLMHGVVRLARDEG